MKINKKLKLGTLVLGLSFGLLNASVNGTGCTGCHGVNWDKKALGKSLKVSEMTNSEIEKALIGYKEGTYGGQMKGLMKGQVNKYSNKEMSDFSKTIGKTDSATVKETTKVVNPTKPLVKKESIKLPENGDIKKGQKLYSKKLKKDCNITGTKIASKHTQDEWSEIWTSNNFSSEIKTICPDVREKSLKEKYLPHYYQFLFEYASDSGNVPSC